MRFFVFYAQRSGVVGLQRTGSATNSAYRRASAASEEGRGAAVGSAAASGGERRSRCAPLSYVVDCFTWNMLYMLNMYNYTLIMHNYAYNVVIFATSFIMFNF